jgi:hypothetical protein
MSYQVWRLALSSRLKLTHRTALLRGTTALGDAGQAEEPLGFAFRCNGVVFRAFVGT